MFKYMHDYRKLRVWNDAMELATMTYTATKQMPKSEQFGLTNQIRRCVVSIASNIAEGSGRGTKKEFARFLMIAKGSCSEFETQIQIANNVGALAQNDFDELSKKADIVSRKLYRLILSMK
ncbi:MAG: four helix bundle protein [Flavobacteriales bacterium]|nr:four helix bundle protein [Flavobacteriales bacterium]